MVKEYSILEWRKRFKKLKKKAKQPLIRELRERDSYFETANGLYDYENVSRGIAGIEKTARIVILLEKKQQKKRPGLEKKMHLDEI